MVSISRLANNSEYNPLCIIGDKTMETKKNERQTTRKNIAKAVADKYLDWYGRNVPSFWGFWWKNFIVPIIYPTIAILVMKFVLNIQLTTVENTIVFGVVYALAVQAQILNRIEQLIKALDIMFDKFIARAEGGKVMEDGDNKKKQPLEL